MTHRYTTFNGQNQGEGDSSWDAMKEALGEEEASKLWWKMNDKPSWHPGSLEDGTLCDWANVVLKSDGSIHGTLYRY